MNTKKELKLELFASCLAFLMGVCGLIDIAVLHYKPIEALFSSIIVCILLIVCIPLLLAYK